MAIKLFRGDSIPVAQVTKVTPANVVIGDTFTLTCNGKSVSYVAAAATVADVVNGLVNAVSSSTIPEFTEMLASPATDNSYLTLTAATAGVPFTITTSTLVTTAGNITVVQTTQGKQAVDEVHKIQLVGTYTGGNFTITYNFGAGNVTTGNIAWNATAAQVQTALAALTGVGAGNVIVTGGPGPSNAWFAQWTGTLGGQSIAVGTINNVSLTGNAGITITEQTRGNGLSTCLQRVSVQFAFSGTFTLTLNGQTTSALNWNCTAAQLQTAIQALANVGSGNALVYGVAATYGGNSDGNHWVDTGYFFVQFTGTLAGVNVAQMTIQTGNLGWNTQIPMVTMLQQGGQTTADEWQLVDLGGATGGSYTLTYGSATTFPIYIIGTQQQPGALGQNQQGEVGPAEQVDWELRNLSGLGNGPSDTGFTGDTGPQIYINYAPCSMHAVHFAGAHANTFFNLLTVNGGALVGSSGATVTRLSQGHANVNEVWQIYTNASGGTFTLTLNSQTTIATAFNASTGTLQTNIQTAFTNSLTTVSVSGAGTLASPWVVTVTNPANTGLGPPTGNGSLLTGGGGTITEQTAGAAGVNEVQTVTEGAGINGGTFTLSFNGAVTAPQAWNVAAATLQTVLRGLSTIGGTNVNVAGSNGGPYTVTFVGALGNQDVALLVGDGSLLTGATGTQTLVAATLTFSSGPNHYNDPINWTGMRIPDSGDTIIFEEGTSNCLFGLQQQSVFTANAGSDTITFTSGSDLLNDQILNVTSTGTLPAPLAAATPYYLINVNRDAGTAQLALTSGGAAIDITTAGTGTHTAGIRAASLEFNSKYTGAVGNSKSNSLGYYEYRPLYLRIGLQASGAKTVTIGTGSGSGSGKIQIDNDVDQAAVKIIQSGGSSDVGIPAILWKGTNGNNTFNLINGSAGIALYGGETASVAPLTMRGGTLELGAGATITGIDKTGGTLISNNATISGTCLL